MGLGWPDSECAPDVDSASRGPDGAGWTDPSSAIVSHAWAGNHATNQPGIRVVVNALEAGIKVEDLT